MFFKGIWKILERILKRFIHMYFQNLQDIYQNTHLVSKSSLAFSFVLFQYYPFTEIIFVKFCCFFCRRFSSAHLLKLFRLPQCVDTTLLQTRAYSLVFGTACTLAYRCRQMKWSVAVTVVAILSQKATCQWVFMCAYVSSGKLSVPAMRCSCALLHNLQPTSDRRLIFASNLATRMIPAIVIISRLSCPQGTCGLFL